MTQYISIKLMTIISVTLLIRKIINKFAGRNEKHTGTGKFEHNKMTTPAPPSNS